MDAIDVVSAFIVLLVLLLVSAYGWYYHTGWHAFAYETGSSPSWGASDISRLRFKDVVFVVSRSDGIVQKKDVSAVLNGMAVAYESAVNKPPQLRLVRRLNAFSFVVEGFNDPVTVRDPSLPMWISARVTLTGDWRLV
jgi:hypothetical protein